MSSSLLIFHGPFTALRSYLIDSLAITRHAYLLRPLSLYTLSNAEIQKHSQGWILSKNVPSTQANRDYSSISHTTIKFDTYSTNMFTANIMLVSNPKSVKVAVTKHIYSVGETVEQMVQDAHGIAGVNGGAFSDTEWHGTGGIPLGTVITDGKFVTFDPKAPVIGITAKGQLVCGTYTKDQLKSMQVEQAVTYGPILVQNGKGVAPTDYGRASRTAIGQTADGTIIFVVTDGRWLPHLGATFKDIQDLMLRYGAVTAANLDGGMSATMVYNGRLVNTPTAILGARHVATAFVVVQ
ncbi:phosphodiester glycosidase family protein [Alicyclobacillus macrosporangiidus]|uniref:phosphodiester glycosidase family protein n=1 Tax=Alicyclobacillus macrosporangiidus TaxID=392015 RepID=UPI00068E1595|nr:phosphodiester glycosidase family protein [Alicyclobacillus macrosporangiidus]